MFSIINRWKNKNNDKNVKRPLRVRPGGLSVSRTFGDIDAKFADYGGKPEVIIAEPEIKEFVIQDHMDFIFLGCDGIFNKLTNEEVNEVIWKTAKKEIYNNLTINNIAGKCISAILEKAMNEKSYDNVTGVLIIFSNFSKTLINGRGLIEILSPKYDSTNKLQKVANKIISPREALSF